MAMPSSSSTTTTGIVTQVDANVTTTPASAAVTTITRKDVESITDSAVAVSRPNDLTVPARVGRRFSSYLPATLLTYCATAWICCDVSLPLNDGIAPLPFVTRVTTSALLGFAWSRLGPTVPCDPASARVWQLVHPAVKKICLPPFAVTFPPPPPP